MKRKSLTKKKEIIKERSMPRGGRIYRPNLWREGSVSAREFIEEQSERAFSLLLINTGGTSG